MVFTSLKDVPSVASAGLCLIDADGQGWTWVLAGTPAWPLVGHGAALDEHLSAPDSPWLPALLGTGETGCAEWAWTTEELGLLQLTG
jgi:hypothetical protein